MLAFIVTATVLLWSAPQDPVFETGRLIENVESLSAPGQRFTLYLPPAFDARKPSPILYLMDPRGRARVPAKLFQAAADRFGYILISSQNTASDGPMEPNLHAMQAMWDDSHAWFAIDPNRRYIAGFSGTARTASLLAQDRPAFTGLIGVGAGFHFAVKPSAGMRFLYFGTFGEADYNFHELQGLQHSLQDLNVPHRMTTFAGPHAWMPPAVAMEAVEWLELRAMKAGARAVDPALIEAWWTRDQTSVRASLDQGHALEASWRYAAMARDYAGLRDTASVARAAAAITASSPARAQMKRRDADGRAWYAWVARSQKAIARAFLEGEAAPALAPLDLSQQLELPSIKRAAAQDGPEAAEARRRLNQLEVQFGFYLPLDALARGDITRAAYYLTLAREIDERSPVSWYLSAQIAARLKRDGDAMAALQRAVDAGFRDLTLLASDRTFGSLRRRADYQALVAWLQQEGDLRDTLTVDRPPVSVLR